ncbi:MAG: hypothetical protein ABR606_03300 [Vicinamibacterales bacterium]
MNGALIEQLVWLAILALPVASVTWTVTHEELFRQVRDSCVDRSTRCRSVVQQKFFYVFTCEYCFSHYVTALFVTVTGYRLLLPDWRGWVIAFFAVNAITNFYMSLYGRLRVEIKSERVDIASKERELPAQADRLNDARPGTLNTTDS